VDDPQSYLNEKTAGTEDGVAKYAFGRCYRDHCGRCLAFAKTGEPKDDFYLFFCQAAIMTTNNAVYRDLEQIGGLDALLIMEDADFKVAQDQIMTSLHRNLVDLREEMDGLLFCKEHLSYEDLYGLLGRRNGVGHTVCEAALAEIWNRDYN
jgi:hypothetical protein